MMKRYLGAVVVLVTLAATVAACSNAQKAPEYGHYDIDEGKTDTDIWTLLNSGSSTAVENTGDDVFDTKEFTGRWRMVYGYPSSDPDLNLMNTQALSIIDFLGDNRMKFQFCFEYVQMFTLDAEYRIVEGNALKEFSDNTWYCSLEAPNTYSEETEGNLYFDFTLNNGMIVGRVSKSDDPTSYVVVYEKEQ